ncbi:ABC transporter permease [Microbacterium sp. HMWF026]|uniref:sugar ABC transporter permease n=1 Tax=Microbacterium sp. HMWF026 TaxID=2056861 RepID=UPI000D37743C|nr:ABC transporter permease [Microbacterium sp. HMWF026]PTT19410.1 ABC transporter permease [Microbacterium sp. HMWF026]
MTATTPAVPTDRQDERLRSSSGFRGSIVSAVERVRSGDLGLLPVILGLAVIWTIFQILNPFFLSSANLSNLLMQSAPIGILALGIVCVLLVGEIDLSVGSVSGLAAAIMAVNFVGNGWPIALALLVAVLAAVVIGFVYGQIYTRLGVPSFVITLAGLLGFLGLQLFVLGPTGTVNLPFDSFLVYFGQLAFVPAPVGYALAVVAGASLFLTWFSRARARRKAGLSAQSTGSILLAAIALTAALALVVLYLYQARGIGWMFVFFVALVLIMNYALTRTSWGRAVYAVGGNREAARRSGINVRATYISVFVLCSTFAAVGGLLAAGRLAAAGQQSGGGDINLNAIAAAVIGGTSLFGGRGSAFAALLGILVIQSISSGLTLLNLDSSIRFMVTGAVVLIAVALDAIARRSRSSHGRA